MTTELYLGRCTYEPRPSTRIQPLAFASDGAWRTYDKWGEFFPSEGTVFSPNHPAWASDGVFAFDTTEAIDPTRGDKFRVRELRKIEEVLDLSQRDPEQVRRAIVENGISGRKSSRETVIVVLPDDLCVRVTLVFDTTRNKSIAELVDLNKLPTYSFDRSLFKGEKFEGRWYAIPEVTVGHQQGFIDWSLDKDFIGSLIKQLKRLSTPETGQLTYPSTKSQVHLFLTTLDRQGLLPAAQGDWRAANTRAWHLASDLRLGFDQIDELVAVLGSLSPIEEKMEETKQSRRRELEAELTASLEAEVKADVQALYADLTNRNSELEEVVQALAAAKTELETDVAALDERHARLKRELLGRAADVASLLEDSGATDNEDLKRVLDDIAKVMREEGFVVAAADGSPPRSRQATFDRSLPPADWESLNSRLVEAAELHGFDGLDIVLADLLARAGEAVLLSEDIARDVVECYASVMAQGAFVVQSLDPSTIGYNDLWRSPSLETPTPLSRAWAACERDSSVARVVLIDGLEKTPLDLWIRPFIDTLRSYDKPRNLLVFVSMAAQVIDADRAYPDLATLLIPLKPRRSSDMTGYFLQRLLGEDVSTSWVDFTAKSPPPETEVQALVKRSLTSKNKKYAKLAMCVSVAAWGTGLADPDGTIRTICENLDGNVAENGARFESLERGREFLRTLL